MHLAAYTPTERIPPLWMEQPHLGKKKQALFSSYNAKILKVRVNLSLLYASRILQIHPGTCNKMQKKQSTIRQQLGFPELKHCTDFTGKLTIQLVCKNVLNTALQENILIEERRRLVKMIVKTKMDTRNCVLCTCCIPKQRQKILSGLQVSPFGRRSSLIKRDRAKLSSVESY